jgi:hypothetical protein
LRKEIVAQNSTSHAVLVLALGRSIGRELKREPGEPVIRDRRDRQVRDCPAAVSENELHIMALACTQAGKRGQ